MEIPNSFTDTGPPIQPIVGVHSAAESSSTTSGGLRPEAVLITDARPHETKQVRFNEHEGRNEVSVITLGCPSVPNATILHQNPQIINTRNVQAYPPTVTRSPEQRRLQSLHQRNQFLTKSVQQLRTRHLSLLHTLQHQLPSPPHTQQSYYHPSTLAHSTPSSIPKFSKGEEEAIIIHAKMVIKEHIARLHAYNEIKDVAQGLMGMVADARGVRVAELYEGGEFGVAEKD